MRRLAILVAALSVVAGCLSSTPGGQDEGSDTTAPATSLTSAAPAPTVSAAPGAAVPTRRVEATWNATGDLTLVAPLDVVLFGYPNATAAKVRAAFTAPYGNAQFTLHSGQRYDFDSPGLPGGAYAQEPTHLVQSVAVRVVEAPDEMAAYRSAVAGDGAWNGTAAESWLAGRLPAWGAALDAPLPPLVVIHAGSPGHAYRLAYPNGFYEGARTWGGTARLLAIDLSAVIDPWAGDEFAYQTPRDPSDGAAIIEAVHQAVRFRLLQAPLYSVPTPPCHAVTLLYAVHATSELGVMSPIEADAALDAARLEVGFEELTREPVFVDVVRLDLPQDDPALGALVRAITTPPVYVGGVPTSAGSYEAQSMVRAWIEDNWDTYHVVHEGCEPYLSLLVFSDAVEGNYFGIAEYDEGAGHRYSFSILGEYVRALYEPGLAGSVFCCADDTVYGFDLVNMLFSHETGHLFGLAHPHNALDDADDGFDMSWSPTRTVMSYLVDERDTGFGTLDRSNWDRNRLGSFAAALEATGLRDAAIEEGFLARIEAGDWRGAHAVAQALLQDA